MRSEKYGLRYLPLFYADLDEKIIDIIRERKSQNITGDTYK